MSGVKVGLAIDPATRDGLIEAGVARGAERMVDDLAVGHLEPLMRRAEPFCETADHLVIGAHALWRFDHLRADHQVRMASREVEIVVFEKHGCRQHDVGEPRRVGQELLVNADEQIVAGEATLHARRVGRDNGGIGGLNQHRPHRRAAPQRVRVARENWPGARLVEHANLRIDGVETLNQAPVEAVDAGTVMHGSATAHLPLAAHRRQAAHRVDVRRAIARARKAVTDADQRPFRLAIKFGERFDLRRGERQ